MPRKDLSYFLLPPSSPLSPFAVSCECLPKRTHPQVTAITTLGEPPTVDSVLDLKIL